MILYSTNCPKCKVLETKLNQAGYKYEIINDGDLMREKGFLEAPVLEVNGETKNFAQALAWLRAGGSVNEDSCDSCKL